MALHGLNTKLFRIKKNSFKSNEINYSEKRENGTDRERKRNR